MATTRTAIKTLRQGKYVMVDGEPCRVLDVTISVPGKHGGAKARMEVIGIFDNRRRSIVKPADTEVEVPIIEKKTAQVVALTPPNVQLMDMETYETFESPIPDDMKDKMKPGEEIQYWVIEGRKMLIGTR